MSAKRELAEGEVEEVSVEETAKRSKTEGGKHPGDWTCSSCEHLNYASRVMCQKCNESKPHPGKHPGDWSCPGCQHHNYASRSACQKCHAARGFTPRGTAMGAGGGGKHPGDWVCASCYDLNYASRQNCRKCSTPKALAGMPASALPGIGGGGGGRNQGRPGDWSCSCGNHNYASRTECRQCNNPKTEEAVQAFKLKLQQQQMGAMGGMGMGGMGGMGMGGGMGGMGMGGMGMGGMGMGGMGMGGMGMGGMGMMGMGMGGMGQQAAPKSRGRVGDWACDCGEHNYASRETCRKCSNAKTTAAVEAFKASLAAQTGNATGYAHPGDWTCPSCSDHNYASRDECRKCQTAKPVAA